MRKWRWGRRIYNGLILVLIVFLSGQILIKSISLSKGSMVEVYFAEYVKKESWMLGQLFIKTSSPVISYIESPPRKTSFADLFIKMVEKTLPVKGFFDDEGESLRAKRQEHYLMDNPSTNPLTWEDANQEGDVGVEIPHTQESLQQEGTAGKAWGMAGEEELIPAVAGPESSIWNPAIKGTEYPLGKLEDYDFLVKNFYAISEITTLTSSELSASNLLSYDFSIEKDSSVPQILIYHTHSQESYIDENGEEGLTVVAAGAYLAKILTEQFGYQVYHDTTQYDMMGGTLDRNKAYTYAESGVTRILSENPSIQMVIDLHRDGVNENMHLVTEINGKPTAEIMFVNGISRTTWQGDIEYLQNPHIEENMALSLQLELKAEAYYPGFTRRIMINAYRYNQHLSDRSLLIEVGAQNNTQEEAMNAMEPLAILLDKVLAGEK